MFNTLDRPYKEQSAKQTIATIQQILHQYDLIPTEVYQNNPYPDIYSTSIALPQEKGGYRTNGKGRSQEFSLASAYAEYIERMQNLLFASFSRTIANILKKEFGYFYFPDESCLSRSAFENLPHDILDDFVRYSGQGREEYLAAYFDRIVANGMPGVVATPFYDTLNQRQKFLPLNLLLITVGSNGMAAGNTQAEAIFQALCELMERWAAALIYYGQLTPPTVPNEFISLFAEEADIIKEIEKEGRYQVTVKDFSAGKRIPSVGMIIKNLKNGCYRLNVGSDTSFQVALSRCLTEIFQGFGDNDQFDERLINIPESVPDYFLQESKEALNRRFHVFTQFTKDNSGVFPPALFGDEPSYTFDPGVFSPLSSYEEEVRHLVRFFHKNGRNVFIRDVSFLGFPSVFVYVPEVSAQGRKSAPSIEDPGRFRVVDLDTIENHFFNLAYCSADVLSEIAEKLSSFESSAPIFQLFNIDLEVNSPWSQVTVAFVLTQIYYRLGEFNNALAHFNAFCDSRKEIEPYYKIVKYLLKFRAHGMGMRQAERQLMNIATKKDVDPSIVKQVVKDMSEPYLIQNFTPFPRCPYCSDCLLSESCQTQHKLSIARTVYSNMTTMPPVDALEWITN
jgi:ribosomal protein S12 methylthiotransferase accessory factor